MRGHDFDHNGRNDSRDYYIYSEVFGEEEGQPAYHSGGRSNAALRWIGYIIAAAYLTPWLRGDLGFGFFSWVIGIVCACILLKPVLEWFGS